MRPERWQAIEELYHSASDLPDGQRQTFLRDCVAKTEHSLTKLNLFFRHGSGPQSFLDYTRRRHHGQGHGGRRIQI